MTMSYVVYICDTETTGFDPVKNDIIEVCFWRLGDPESKTWCLKPLNISAIEDRALTVNNHKKEDLLHKTASGKEKYRLPAEVLPEIEDWILSDNASAENRIFVGQNPEFDYNFLRALWEKTGHADDFPFGYWIGDGVGRKNMCYFIDTIQIARLIDLCTGQHRTKYNLTSLCKDFDIPKAQAHRADGDVKMTRDLFLKMIEPLKQVIIDNFSNSYK